MIGNTILHYKILEKLGEGGMGVVYKAEDTKLEREVAIKFLPRKIAASSEERERFETEAKAAAALNHANIATIHYVEEAEDETFIVMEFVDGQELKDKIEAGPLPIDSTLDLAIQIAKGLQAAHAKDVVHRDIKSANIMLTQDGTAKIMDFGLAKRAGKTKLTQEGTTLGTIAYMSPEQTRGDDVDQRSDIFSLGVLLYEMVTGQLPFKGDYDQAVTYSILNEEPEPVTGLRTGIPMELERIVNKCLEKDASNRYPSAEDLIVDLGKLKKESETKAIISDSGIQAAQPKSAKPPYLMPLAILVAILVLVLGYLMFGPGFKSDPKRLVNPRQLTSGIGIEAHPTWSADGGRLAYTVWPGGMNADVWVMQLGGGQPANLTKDFPALDFFPSWSQDGTQIAFASLREGGGFFAMPAVGGRPRSLVSGVNFLQRPIWLGSQGALAYTIQNADGHFVEILDLESRETRRLALPGKSYNRIDLNWSEVRHTMAYVDATAINADVTQLWILQESSGEAYPITDGLWNDRSPTWSPDGSKLYFVSNRGGSMDLWQFHLTKDGRSPGPPEQLTVGVGMQDAVFSPDGSRLAYSRGRRVANIWRVRIPKTGEKLLTWSDAEQLTFDNALIEFVDVSPDGKHLLFSSDRTGNQDIWKMDVTGGELEQLTTAPTPDWSPAWSHDGNQIAYYSYRTGNRDIWIMPAKGGASKQITNHPAPDSHPTWSPDGKKIAFMSSRQGGLNLWTQSLEGGEPVQLTQGTRDVQARWSPDGNWIAFLSSEGMITGLWMIPASGGDLKPQIAGDDSGAIGNIVWSPEGEHIYFTKSSNLWEFTVVDGSQRQLTDLKGRYGELGREDLATDGEYLYFPWMEDTGDLWVMDVEKDE